MRVRRLLAPAILAATVAGSALTGIPSSAANDVPAHYYLALGDSLSRGYMPGAGDTDQGYADDLFATLQAKDPSLQLVKLGCSGETTTTMVDGGKCTDRYPLGSSQLDAAEQFLREHAGAVTYLTLDIGANDVDNCASGGSIDAACVTNGVVTITENLNTILSGLVGAFGSTRPRAAGMAYYDPFLAEWLTGTQGKLVATASVPLLGLVNTTEASLYALHGFRFSDISRTFHTLDFLTLRTVAPYGTLPTNVAYICQYTYMCSQQNIHANVAGYQLIATALAGTLTS